MDGAKSVEQKGLLSQLDMSVNHLLSIEGIQNTTSVKRATDIRKFALQKGLTEKMQSHIQDNLADLQQAVTERAGEYQSLGMCPKAAGFKAQQEVLFELKQHLLEEKDPVSYNFVKEMEHNHLHFKLSPDKVPLGFLEKLPEFVEKNHRSLGDNAYSLADHRSETLLESLDLNNGVDTYDLTIVAKACGGNLVRPSAQVYESSIVMSFDHQLDDIEKADFEERMKSEGYSAFNPEVTSYGKRFTETTTYNLNQSDMSVTRHTKLILGEFKGQYEHTDLLGLCPSLGCAGVGYDVNAPLTLEASSYGDNTDGPCGGCGGCGNG